MRKLPLVILATVAVGGLPGLTPADGAAGIRCTGSYPVTISPGFSTQPNSGTFHSGGEPGTIKCDDGRSGTIGIDGRYGVAHPDSCTAGLEGAGVQRFTLHGAGTMKNNATFKGGGLENGFFNGSFHGDRMSGDYTFLPSKGDCVTAPVTRGEVKFHAVLHR